MHRKKKGLAKGNHSSAVDTSVPVSEDDTNPRGVDAVATSPSKLYPPQITELVKSIPSCCLVCDAPINRNSVLFHCECLVVYCQSCAILQVASQPQTYTKGIQCPYCRQPSYNIKSIEECKHAETVLIERAFHHYKVRTSRNDDGLARTLQLFHGDGYVGMLTEDDLSDVPAIYPALRLELARLEYFRENCRLDSLGDSKTLPLGPLEHLTFTRNIVLEHALDIQNQNKEVWNTFLQRVCDKDGEILANEATRAFVAGLTNAIQAESFGKRDSSREDKTRNPVKLELAPSNVGSNAASSSSAELLMSSLTPVLPTRGGSDQVNGPRSSTRESRLRKAPYDPIYSYYSSVVDESEGNTLRIQGMVERPGKLQKVNEQSYASSTESVEGEEDEIVEEGILDTSALEPSVSILKETVEKSPSSTQDSEHHNYQQNGLELACPADPRFALPSKSTKVKVKSGNFAGLTCTVVGYSQTGSSVKVEFVDSKGFKRRTTVLLKNVVSVFEKTESKAASDPDNVATSEISASSLQNQKSDSLEPGTSSSPEVATGNSPENLDGSRDSLEASGSSSSPGKQNFCLCNKPFRGFYIPCNVGICCNGFVHPGCCSDLMNKSPAEITAQFYKPYSCPPCTLKKSYVESAQLLSSGNDVGKYLGAASLLGTQSASDAAWRGSQRSGPGYMPSTSSAASAPDGISLPKSGVPSNSYLSPHSLYSSPYVDIMMAQHFCPYSFAHSAYGYGGYLNPYVRRQASSIGSYPSMVDSADVSNRLRQYSAASFYGGHPSVYAISPNPFARLDSYGSQALPTSPPLGQNLDSSHQPTSEAKIKVAALSSGPLRNPVDGKLPNESVVDAASNSGTGAGLKEISTEATTSGNPSKGVEVRLLPTGTNSSNLQINSIMSQVGTSPLKPTVVTPPTGNVENIGSVKYQGLEQVAAGVDEVVSGRVSPEDLDGSRPPTHLSKREVSRDVQLLRWMISATNIFPVLISRDVNSREVPARAVNLLMQTGVAIRRGSTSYQAQATELMRRLTMLSEKVDELDTTTFEYLKKALEVVRLQEGLLEAHEAKRNFMEMKLWQLLSHAGDGYKILGLQNPILSAILRILQWCSQCHETFSAMQSTDPSAKSTKNEDDISQLLRFATVIESSLQQIIRDNDRNCGDATLASVISVISDIPFDDSSSETSENDSKTNKSQTLEQLSGRQALPTPVVDAIINATSTPTSASRHETTRNASNSTVQLAGGSADATLLATFLLNYWRKKLSGLQSTFGSSLQSSGAVKRHGIGNLAATSANRGFTNPYLNFPMSSLGKPAFLPVPNSRSSGGSNIGGPLPAYMPFGRRDDVATEFMRRGNTQSVMVNSLNRSHDSITPNAESRAAILPKWRGGQGRDFM